MLIPEEAWQLLAARIPEKRDTARTVPRAEALGRVLAEPLQATVDMPPADVSAMDGYAVAGEVAPGGAVPVVGVVAAGRPPEVELAPGTAAKIMTGAMVPRGADRVIPVEESEDRPPAADGVPRVAFVAVPEAGRHVRRGGEVTRRGEVVLEAGSLLTPGAVSLAASHGHGTLRVIAPPSVAVVTTGDELVPPDEEPAPGQLRDSNTAFLVAAGRTLGLPVDALGIAPDRPGELEKMIDRGLERDVLLLSGGVSMGDFDFVEDVLTKLGCELLFDKVAIQPGKPLVAGCHDGGWVFGLPGNPASVMVTFWLFVRPLLRRLMGKEDAFWHGALAAELTAPILANKARDRFYPARVDFDGGRVLATPQASKGSHDVAAFARGTALLRRRPHAPAASLGEPCEVLPLADWVETPYGSRATG